MKTTKNNNGYVPPIVPINVQKKTVRQSDALPPCCTKDLYSFDDGKTWVSAKKFFDWKRNVILVNDIYAMDNYIIAKNKPTVTTDDGVYGGIYEG